MKASKGLRAALGRYLLGSRPRAGGENPRVLFAGGGTGGHVLPALSVAGELARGGLGKKDIVFVGARRGQEKTLVPAAGFEVRLLPGRGLRRQLSAENVKALAEFVEALVASVRLLRELRPDVVVAVGGYASVAPSLVAWLSGVPLAVLNVDVVPGASNRLLARLAAVTVAAWEGSGLPRCVVTGAPLRPELAEADKSPAARTRAREALAIPTNRHLVVVVGGSLGSATLNAAALELAEIWQNRDDIVLWHVVGRRDWPTHAKLWSGSDVPGRILYRPVEYEERMGDLLVASDVVVARSGAGSVAELAVVGRPAILVPFPGAPGDHQAANAAILCSAGAALMVRDADATGARLASLLDGLLASPARLEAMGMRACGLGRPHAAAEVASIVGELAGRGRMDVPSVGAVGTRSSR